MGQHFLIKPKRFLSAHFFWLKMFLVRKIVETRGKPVKHYWIKKCVIDPKVLGEFKKKVKILDPK